MPLAPHAGADAAAVPVRLALPRAAYGVALPDLGQVLLEEFGVHAVEHRAYAGDALHHADHAVGLVAVADRPGELDDAVGQGADLDVEAGEASIRLERLGHARFETGERCRRRGPRAAHAPRQGQPGGEAGGRPHAQRAVHAALLRVSVSKHAASRWERTLKAGANAVQFADQSPHTLIRIRP